MSLISACQSSQTYHRHTTDMVAKLLVLLAAVSATLAADPTPCCAHHQFTADLLEVGGRINPKTMIPEPITVSP